MATPCCLSYCFLETAPCESSQVEEGWLPLQFSSLENLMDRGAWQAVYSSQGRKESDMTEATSHAHTHPSQELLTFEGSDYGEGFGGGVCVAADSSQVLSKSHTNPTRLALVLSASCR